MQPGIVFSGWQLSGLLPVTELLSSTVTTPPSWFQMPPPRMAVLFVIELLPFSVTVPNVAVSAASRAPGRAGSWEAPWRSTAAQPFRRGSRQDDRSVLA